VLFGRAFFRQKLRVGWGLPPTAIVFRFLFGSPIPSALEPHLPKGGRESRASMIGLWSRAFRMCWRPVVGGGMFLRNTVRPRRSTIKHRLSWDGRQPRPRSVGGYSPMIFDCSSVKTSV